MAYTKTVWQDRQVTFPLRFTQTLVSGTTYDLVPAEGTVITSGTAINATNLNNIENGIEALDLGKFNKTGGAITGDLTLTKVSPAIIYDDTDALGTRCAITNYQSKLSFRYGANSTANEMMYLDGVTGLTFKPNLAYTGASTIGQSGIHMKNSDIVGLNGLYFNDEAQADGEGFNFPKTGISGASTTQTDYTCLRVDGEGILRLGSVVEGNVKHGDTLWSGASFLTDTQTLTPSVPIADCPNGWALVWSDYDSATSTSNDFDWAITFIHKNQALNQFQLHVIGSTVTTTTKDYVVKSLRFTATTVSGNSVNDDGGNGSNDVVLRRIFMW